jgi:hypothetical protein
MRRRCLPTLGYGPKTLARPLRFQRFLELAPRSPAASLAQLTALPHLVRNGNAIVYPRYQATDSLSELRDGAQVRQA